MLTLLVIVSPMLVKADQLSLKTNAYSTTITTGSEFTFSMEVKENDFQGVVNFDNDVLEFVDIEIEYAGEGAFAGSLGTVNKEVTSGAININYTKGNNPATLLIAFKAKAVPANGKTTIKVVPSGQMWFGQPQSTITIVASAECPASDEKECTVCENNKTAAKATTDNNEMLLYGSLGACGVLAIAVIILAVKKK